MYLITSTANPKQRPKLNRKNQLKMFIFLFFLSMKTTNQVICQVKRSGGSIISSKTTSKHVALCWENGSFFSAFSMNGHIVSVKKHFDKEEALRRYRRIAKMIKGLSN
jgi:hypothetical protein